MLCAKVRLSACILVLEVHISYFPYLHWQLVHITVLFHMPKEYQCTNGGTYFGCIIVLIYKYCFYNINKNILKCLCIITGKLKL